MLSGKLPAPHLPRALDGAPAVRWLNVSETPHGELPLLETDPSKLKVLNF